MIIVVESPDKLSLSMFTDFYRSAINQSTQLYDMNALHSDRVKEHILMGILKRSQKDGPDVHHLIKYKKMKKMKPGVPPYIERDADFIFRFDMYSTHLETLKHRTPELRNLIEKKWGEGLKRLGHA